MVAHAGKVLTHRFMLAGNLGRRRRCTISAYLYSCLAPEDRGGPRAAYPYPHRNRRRLSSPRAGPMIIQRRSAPHLPENARSAKSPCEGTAMDLADLIEPNRVIFAARASNKEQLLQDLASRAAALLNLDAQTIFNALQAREELGSTGLGNGFALPHARIEGLDRLFGMFARLNRPVHFDVDRRQAGRSRVSPAHPANRRQRASWRPCRGFTASARPRVRSETSQGSQRHRALQASLRSSSWRSDGFQSWPRKIDVLDHAR